MPANGKYQEPPSAADLRAEIERARQQIQGTVVALRHEVNEAADWRAWYRRRPEVWLGAAFALGFYLGRRR